ncbi:phospholipase A1-like [Diabrotica undecimpunctata]|uniref:phospholipase A1-like n=1 Tax=Diabrotica undecimpunctata TaxID=50387 RepID=UPI003B6422C1
MRLQIKIFLLCAFVFAGITCNIPNTLKKDFFQIYKGLAVEAKQLTGTHVTIDKLTFTHFDKKHLENGTLLDSSNLEDVKYAKEKIVFILHGWASSATVDWVLDMKNAFLTIYPNSSVITIDWSGPASQPYSISSINTYDVGNFMADMILDLINKHNVDIKKFLLVGHSLGGQACGFAGKKLQSVGKILPRIIGLDPAGPLFSIRPKDKRLNPTDAEVVEVIHSDGGRFGFDNPCGTIDFFPNGGKWQPGCQKIDLLDITSVADPVTCDHQRSHEYFTEAILNPGDFLATKCTQYTLLFKKCDENYKVPLGDLTTTLKGNFYFETNKERPYAKRQKGPGVINKISNLFKH